MSEWKISDAKARFSELIARGRIEPQIISNRSRPVAVLIGYERFREIEKAETAASRPSMREALAELAEINRAEADLETIPRADRPDVDLGR